MEKNNYNLFCEHMQRYEAGERELNKEEKAYEEFLISNGTAFQPLVFDSFLKNMERYQSENKAVRHR